MIKAWRLAKDKRKRVCKQFRKFANSFLCKRELNKSWDMKTEYMF